jgi:outer membrane protein assembly factor BamB
MKRRTTLLRAVMTVHLTLSCIAVSLHAQESGFRSCGIADIDQIRREVKSTPTTAESYLNRRAALSRWWRLLWRQGCDMSSFSEVGGYITHMKPSAQWARKQLDKGYAILEQIQANPRRIPDIRGAPGRAGTKTDWPMYLSTDGSQTGYSPDPGPSAGEIVWRFPKHYRWNARPVMQDGRIYLSAPGPDVVGYCLDEKTGKTLWRARQHGFDFYHTWGSAWDPVATEDRVVIRIGGSGIESLVVDKQTGQQAQEPQRGGPRPAGPGGELMVYALAPGKVCVANARTGRFLWKYDLPALPAGAPVLIGHKIYAAAEDGTVCRIDTRTRASDWKEKLPVALRGGISVHETSVCLGSADGRLFCLSTDDGQVLWSWQCEEKEDRAFQFFSTPRESNGRVYVGAASGHLHCLDAATGANLWKYDTGSWIRSRPLAVGDVVYAATLDGDLHAVKDDGRRPHEQWRVKLCVHGFTADLVGDPNRILLPGKDLILYSVSPATGQVQWRHGIIDGTWIDGEFFAASGMTGFMTSPAIVQDTMYIGGPDGFVNAVDVNTGKEKWRCEISGGLSGVPVVAENKVFVGRMTAPGGFWALDQETGRRIWETREFGRIWVAPAYHDGMLFFGNIAGDVFGVQASDGERVWSYYTAKDTPIEKIPRGSKQVHGFPPGVYSNPAIDDRTVYVGSWSGYYFALDQRTGQLKWRTKTMPEHGNGGRPDSAAPMLHKNHLYVQKAGTHVAALHKDTGELKWEWKAPAGFLQNGTVAAHGNRTFASIVRGVTKLPYHATIIAFSDVESGGEKLWEYGGGGGLTAPVVTDDKVIFGSSADVFLTCLSPDDGSVIWRTYTGGEMLENVPALYGDKVFVQCRNGWVFAVR